MGQLYQEHHEDFFLHIAYSVKLLSLSMHQDNHGYIWLLIQGATKEDAGWYTVSAKNEAGIVSCTARLDI
ncbi:hypothetical protein A6R68_05428, partial [Neotoma lepida]